MGFNKIILEGRLTKDPELRYSQGGIAMAKGNIAVSKRFTSNGEKKEKTLFVNLQFWKKSAEIFNQYCRKGSHILIEGELENANWTDNQGNKKYDFIINVSNMQMLDSKSQQQGQQPQQQPQQQYQAPQPTYQNANGQPVPPQQYKQNMQQQMPQNTTPPIDVDEDIVPF